MKHLHIEDLEPPHVWEAERTQASLQEARNRKSTAKVKMQAPQPYFAAPPGRRWNPCLLPVAWPCDLLWTRECSGGGMGVLSLRV